ncbi:cytidine deaminase [Rikenella microfusus]|uniref:Cytidine deaminase n=1 Tax=Rikenella microfusus TaxID=28139 RepID=A0A379MTK1_9BACT|nr:cytidine deaminase [Rikenella microfusus]SUE34240.1 Cytidine deaminase [Rikenella microfusus]HJE87539.1 cytidine deaminase [Rikenella microfusus]
MDNKELINKALESSKQAWAPYSGFRVGAAVRLEDGTVVCGNNQENRAYPLGSCAERVAVNYARATYPTVPIVAIAVVSPDSETPVTPCGGCREVLMEAVRAQHGRDIRVIMADRTGNFRETMATELLPFAFRFK